MGYKGDSRVTIYPIIRGATTLNEAMDIKNAQKNMKNTAEQVFRLIDISSLME